MPAFLKEVDESMLAVELGGMRGSEFQDALARIKSIPGRRWNPETKQWQFPHNAETAMKIMRILEPNADASVQAMVQKHAAEISQQLITKIGDDAEINWHNADKLRPYQRAGVAWLVEHPKSILADEMGLGKTVEAIATTEEYWHQALSRDPALQRGKGGLVVCPNAVRGVWQEEYDQWSPDTGVQVIDGKKPATRISQLEDEDPDVWIINWEKLRLMPELGKQNWDFVIADEAHRAKNRKAQQTKALWKITAPLQLALTGTPLMNHPGELFALMRWLRGAKEYGSYWDWYYSYCDEYVASYNNHVVMGVKNADELRFVLSDKLARRTKSDVLKDLPPKTTQVLSVALNPKQRKLYKEAEEAFWLDVTKHFKEKGEDVPDELSVKEAALLIPNGGARMTRLRQIASSPAILGGPDDSAKLDAAVEIIRDNPDKPFVVFTWFTDTVSLLKDRLTRGKPPLRVGTIAGSDDPDPVKDAFQAGELDIVICTIAKGGVGLTLTAADTAIFVEKDWVPAINDQAADRLHRIGQTNPVTIIEIEAANTIDTGKIAPANKLKRSITTQVLGETA